MPNKKWTNAPHTDEELLEVLGMLASLQDMGDPRVTWPNSQRAIRSQTPGGERYEERNRITSGDYQSREMNEWWSDPTFERPMRARPGDPGRSGYDMTGTESSSYRRASPAVEQMRKERVEALLDRKRRMREIKRNR